MYFEYVIGLARDLCQNNAVPSPFGYMGYNNQMDNVRYCKLEKQEKYVVLNDLITKWSLG